MLLVQQRNQEMSNANIALQYSRIGKVSFDDMGDALDFINTIESRTRPGYINY